MRFGKKKGTFMKSRLAVVMVLALGMVCLGGSGAALAASGSSGSGSAGSAQYPEENETSSICSEEEGTAGSGSAGSGAGCVHTETCEEEALAGSEAAAQNGTGSGEGCEEPTPAAQPASGGGGHGKLPFTGFPVIPAVLIGVGLLGAGVAMRFRVRSGAQF